MKYIDKRNEPPEMLVWKAQACDDWRPTWAGLANPERTKLREALLAEQGYICCYCQSRIKDNTDSHIEHFKPRSAFPAEQLNYYNLLASCANRQHCESKKTDWYDPTSMISPLESDCEAQFSYTSRGMIRASETAARKNAAEAMISKLKLNCDSLTRRRRDAIDGILPVLETIGAADISKLIRNFSAKNGDGQFEPFCMAIVGLLRNYQ